MGKIFKIFFAVGMMLVLPAAGQAQWTPPGTQVKNQQEEKPQPEKKSEKHAPVIPAAALPSETAAPAPAEATAPAMMPSVAPVAPPAAQAPSPGGETPAAPTQALPIAPIAPAPAIAVPSEGAAKIEEKTQATPSVPTPASAPTIMPATMPDSLPATMPSTMSETSATVKAATEKNPSAPVAALGVPEQMPPAASADSAHKMMEEYKNTLDRMQVMMIQMQREIGEMHKMMMESASKNKAAAP